MLRNCKFERDEDRYGHFPLTNRFSMDQVPIEISRRNTTPEQQGRSAQKDQTNDLENKSRTRHREKSTNAPHQL